MPIVTDTVKDFCYNGKETRIPSYLVPLKSRLTIVSREAKKKLAVRDERVSYLQVAPL